MIIVTNAEFRIWRCVQVALMTTNDINNGRYRGTLIVDGRRVDACRKPWLNYCSRILQ